jgi:hypothetical protein
MWSTLPVWIEQCTLVMMNVLQKSASYFAILELEKQFEHASF